jgi:hypothetical protein
MFQIPVGDILSSYAGDSKSFSFSGEIFDGFFEDLQFLKPLTFQIRLMSLDDGVEVYFEQLETEVKYEWKKHPIHISRFERTWKTHIDPMIDGDDVQQLDTKTMSIDLAPVIREELIMASHTF